MAEHAEKISVGFERIINDSRLIVNVIIKLLKNSNYVGFGRMINDTDSKCNNKIVNKFKLCFCYNCIAYMIYIKSYQIFANQLGHKCFYFSTRLPELSREVNNRFTGWAFVHLTITLPTQ